MPHRNGSDEKFLNILLEKHARNKCLKRPRIQNGTFAIAHYAGEVLHPLTRWFKFAIVAVTALHVSRAEGSFCVFCLLAFSTPYLTINRSLSSTGVG